MNDVVPLFVEVAVVEDAGDAWFGVVREWEDTIFPSCRFGSRA